MLTSGPFLVLKDFTSVQFIALHLGEVGVGFVEEFIRKNEIKFCKWL